MHSRRNGPGAQVSPNLENLGVPPALVIAGLADGHRYPHASMGRDGNGNWRGTGRVPAKLAWTESMHVQHDTGSSKTGVWLDVDKPGAVQAAVDAGKVPAPSVQITRKSNGHSAVGYMLRRPVHSYPGARQKPLLLFRLVEEYIRFALQADCGYTGTLFRNVGVASKDARFVVETRPGGYSLAELFDWIPDGWYGPPRVSAESLGRNCSMFDALMKLAGRKIVLDEAIRRSAAGINDGFKHPLPENEVANIVNQVLKYRRRWREVEWHSQAFRRKQAARGHRGGLKSGEVRRARAAERRQKAVALAEEGASLKEIREQLGVSRTTVWRYL